MEKATGEWTKEERHRFLHALKVLGGKGTWKSVADIVGTRDNTQCQNYYKNHFVLPIGLGINVFENLRPDPALEQRAWELKTQKDQKVAALPYNQGPWSDEEKNLFNIGLNMYGKGKWVEIADVVTTRTNKQCATRYHAMLEKKKRAAKLERKLEQLQLSQPAQAPQPFQLSHSQPLQQLQHPRPLQPSQPSLQLQQPQPLQPAREIDEAHQPRDSFNDPDAADPSDPPNDAAAEKAAMVEDEHALQQQLDPSNVFADEEPAALDGQEVQQPDPSNIAQPLVAETAADAPAPSGSTVPIDRAIADTTSRGYIAPSDTVENEVIKNLRLQLQDAHSKLEKACQEKEKLDGANRRLHSELENVTADRLRLHSQLEKATDENIKLDKENRKLRKDLHELKKVHEDSEKAQANSLGHKLSSQESVGVPVIHTSVPPTKKARHDNTMPNESRKKNSESNGTFSGTGNGLKRKAPEQKRDKKKPVIDLSYLLPHVAPSKKRGGTVAHRAQPFVYDESSSGEELALKRKATGGEQRCSGQITNAGSKKRIGHASIVETNNSLFGDVADTIKQENGHSCPDIAHSGNGNDMGMNSASLAYPDGIVSSCHEAATGSVESKSAPKYKILRVRVPLEKA